MKPFLKVDPTQSQNNFILEVIQTDIYCHLEVTVVQQGHFGIKSTVAQKWKEIRPKLPHKTNRKSMSDGAILDDLGTRPHNKEHRFTHAYMAAM